MCVLLRQLNIDRVRDGKIVQSCSESFSHGFNYQLTRTPAPTAVAAGSR